MDKLKGKLLSLNICCFGINYVAVPVAAVFAQMCPFLNIAVVDLNSEKVTSWNTKQINMREQGLEEILKKCQNRNLVFTTDVKSMVRIADLVFLCMNPSARSQLNGEEKLPDLSDIEKAVRLIAEVSESNKIVVIKSTAPFGISENIKRILMANRPNNVHFQVLSIPVLSSTGNAVSSLINPDRILIGRDISKEGLEAAETLVTIYSRWIPRDRILTMSNSSAEISKLSQNAFLAQRLSNLSALSIICEETGADISEIIKVIREFSGIGPHYLEPSFGFGGPHLKNDLKSLIYMCERLNLKEAAEYWKEVLLMNEYQKKRFIKKILSCFFNTLGCEKIAIWGIAFKKNADILEESPGVELCLNLLTEGAKVNVYDKLEKRQVMEGLNAAAKKNGFDPPLILKELTYFEDPYKAAYKTDAIVLCNDLDELKNLNFNVIYKDMIKPPYIFDGRKCLPHEELIKIGFIVKTIGKRFDIYN